MRWLFANLARDSGNKQADGAEPVGRAPRAQLAQPRYVITGSAETGTCSAGRADGLCPTAARSHRCVLRKQTNCHRLEPVQPRRGITCLFVLWAAPPTAGGTHGGFGLWHTLLCSFLVQLPL